MVLADQHLLQPIVAVQNALPPSLVSVGMGLVVFAQNFGGALSLAFAQTTFNTGLSQSIPEFAPSIGASLVIDAGAGHVRTAVPKAALQGVLQAYAQSVDHVFYLSAAFATTAFIFSWGMGWKDVRTKKTQSHDENPEDEKPASQQEGIGDSH